MRVVWVMSQPTYNSQMWRDTPPHSVDRRVMWLVDDSTGQKTWELCVTFWVISHLHILHIWVPWHPDAVNARVTWTLVDDSAGPKTCESCVTCEPCVTCESCVTCEPCVTHHTLVNDSTEQKGMGVMSRLHVYIYLADECRDTHIFSRHKSDVTL